MSDAFRLVKILDGLNISIDTAGILNKYDATTGPAVTDDTAGGYSIGSHWIDVTADEAYICVDATNGAAVWLNISTGVEFAAHIADATIHFTEGSIDHTAITNIGTRSHATIDSELDDLEVYRLINL